MKFAIKSIVAAAAFVAVGAASAATYTLNGTSVTNGLSGTGTGQLEFSEDLMGALVTGNVTIGAFGGASLTTVTRTYADPTLGTYDAAVITATLNTIITDATGAVTQAISTGGATQSMPKNAGIKAAGGNAQVGNLDVRFTATGADIYGTITGTSLTGTAVNYSGNLFTVLSANISGATKVAGEGTFVTQLNDIAITTAGFDALVSVFGLTKGGAGYLALQGAAANFGDLTSTVKVAAVPEPSTYALMGLGLVGLSLVARRRAK